MYETINQGIEHVPEEVIHSVEPESSDENMPEWFIPLYSLVTANASEVRAWSWMGGAESALSQAMWSHPSANSLEASAIPGIMADIIQTLADKPPEDEEENEEEPELEEENVQPEEPEPRQNKQPAAKKEIKVEEKLAPQDVQALRHQPIQQIELSSVEGFTKTAEAESRPNEITAEIVEQDETIEQPATLSDSELAVEPEAEANVHLEEEPQIEQMPVVTESIFEEPEFEMLSEIQANDDSNEKMNIYEAKLLNDVVVEEEKLELEDQLDEPIEPFVFTNNENARTELYEEADLNLAAEEIENELIELAETIKLMAPEEQVVVGQILDETMGVARRFNDGAGENSLPQIEKAELGAEAQNELKTLLVELFDYAGMECPDELAQDLAELVVKWALTEEIVKLIAAESDDSPVDSGTHEAIKHLLVCLANQKNPVGRARTVGRPVLKFYMLAAA